MIILSSEGNKEKIEKTYKDYLELKEEKVRNALSLAGGSKDVNAECDNIKKQSSKYNDMVIRHKSQIEKFNRHKKTLQDELKALNDTINLKSRELKLSLSKFSEEQYSDYFNYNKDLLKILLLKENKSVSKNHQYEFTKENLQENVLIDHSRKKTNMYMYLKKKYLFEYLCHLYSEDNLDLKGINERTKKSYTELIQDINNDLKEIKSIKDKINNYDQQIRTKNSHSINPNYAGDHLIEKLNYKVQTLQNDISTLENKKYQEDMEFENKRYTYEEEIKTITQKIKDLKSLLYAKLNNMTCGNINLYLKYDKNARNFNPDKDRFNPNIHGYSLREFDFQPEYGIMLIKDKRNKITEKKIKYEFIKRIRLDAESEKIVEKIERKYYKDEKEKNKDVNRKKKIKFFIILRKDNLDLVAKEYNDYKVIADIINSIVIHK